MVNSRNQYINQFDILFVGMHLEQVHYVYWLEFAICHRTYGKESIMMYFVILNNA